MGGTLISSDDQMQPKWVEESGAEIGLVLYIPNGVFTGFPLNMGILSKRRPLVRSPGAREDGTGGDCPLTSLQSTAASAPDSFILVL